MHGVHINLSHIIFNPHLSALHSCASHLAVKRLFQNMLLTMAGLTDKRDLECAICSHTIGCTRPDKSVETHYALPCSHVFGSHCILRWLQISPRQDCPNCRRRMVHRGCGHLIMPHNAVSAPPSIPESQTPERCVRCRGEGIVALALRSEHEKLLAQESALRGMRSHLPSIFGSFATASLCGVDQRIAELRKGFAVFHERAWKEFEERERRERW